MELSRLVDRTGQQRDQGRLKSTLKQPQSAAPGKVEPSLTREGRERKKERKTLLRERWESCQENISAAHMN